MVSNIYICRYLREELICTLVCYFMEVILATLYHAILYFPTVHDSLFAFMIFYIRPVMSTEQLGPEHCPGGNVESRLR